jgi:hypothetical protein
MVARAQVLTQALQLPAEERASLIAELASSLLDRASSSTGEGDAGDPEVATAQETVATSPADPNWGTPTLERLRPLTLSEVLQEFRLPRSIDLVGAAHNQFHAVKPGSRQSQCGRVRAYRRDPSGHWPDNSYRFGYTAEARKR